MYGLKPNELPVVGPVHNYIVLILAIVGVHLQGALKFSNLLDFLFACQFVRSLTTFMITEKVLKSIKRNM